MVTLAVAATFVVAMLNLAEVAPAGTATVAGTVADALELLRVMTAPVEGAGPVRYTVLPVDETPPTKAAGESATEDNTTGLTVSVAGLVTPPYDPEIVTLVAAATLIVEMLNLAEVAPAGTGTVGDTVADGPELLKVTTAPPDGAGPVR